MLGEPMIKELTAPDCSCTVIHQDRIDSIRGKMPPEEILAELSDFFKIFGDTTRLKMIHALIEKEMCVCDLSALLGMNQSAISHQLKMLRVLKLVKFRKEGKVIRLNFRWNEMYPNFVGLIKLKRLLPVGSYS